MGLGRKEAELKNLNLFISFRHVASIVKGSPRFLPFFLSLHPEERSVANIIVGTRSLECVARILLKNRIVSPARSKGKEKREKPIPRRKIRFHSYFHRGICFNEEEDNLSLSLSNREKFSFFLDAAKCSKRCMSLKKIFHVEIQLYTFRISNRFAVR